MRQKEWTPITEDEQEVVTRLQEKLHKNCPYSTDANHKQLFRDLLVLRFLRSREHDEDVAYDSLLKYAEFRQEYEVDSALTLEYMDKFASEQKKKKYEIVENGDFESRPVAYVYVHRHDKNDCNCDQLRYMIIYILEKLLSCSREGEERMVIAMDLSQFGMSCMDYEVAKLLVELLKSFYPETMHCICMVDSPWVFSAFWNVIKQWLHPVTLEKIKFLPRTELHNFLRLESIPNDFAQIGFESETKINDNDEKSVSVEPKNNEENGSLIEKAVSMDDTDDSNSESNSIDPGFDSKEDETTINDNEGKTSYMESKVGVAAIGLALGVSGMLLGKRRS